MKNKQSKVADEMVKKLEEYGRLKKARAVLLEALLSGRDIKILYEDDKKNPCEKILRPGAATIAIDQYDCAICGWADNGEHMQDKEVTLFLKNVSSVTLVERRKRV